MAQRIEAVVIGCGKPKFSMGWTHAYQLLQPPLSEMCTLTGVVEPFLLSPAAAADSEHRASRDELREFFRAEAPNAAVVDAIEKLPPVAAGKVRVGWIAVRTADARATFEAAVDPERGGCHAIYLEKPGAPSVAELDAIIRVAEQRGVTVMTGYSRNLGNAVTGALAFARGGSGAGGVGDTASTSADGRVASDAPTEESLEPRIELVHCNPWSPAELPECWRRCRPGMMFDMACHDLAIGVAYFGLTAADLMSASNGSKEGEADAAPALELDVDTSPGASVQATYDGITDFIRLKFALRRRQVGQGGQQPQPRALHFWVDRCAGAFNGVHVTLTRGESTTTAEFHSGDDPLWPNPLTDLSPHLACQYDYYVEAKRVLLKALAESLDSSTNPAGDGCSALGTVQLPAGAPTLTVAREVLLLAESLSGKLHAAVPFENAPE